MSEKQWKLSLICWFGVIVVGVPCFGIEEAVELEPIVVTASRIPSHSSHLTRFVTVIDAQELKKLPARSLSDVLNYAIGVDARQRSPYEVQTDLTMRGSTFQQVLVMIDGVRVSDPQTAHHTMNLPISVQDIERVEILYGNGSSLYGPDAFSGVVNVITKKPDKKFLNTELNYGSYNTYGGSVSTGYKIGKLGFSLSIDGKKSDGWRYDTDFTTYNVFSNSSYNFKWCDLLVSLGVAGKEFGANGFYGSSPSKEWTNAKFVKAELNHNGDISWEEKIYYRQHNDKYINDINAPTSYVNDHTNYIYGQDFRILFGNFVVGSEVAGANIESTRLGSHNNYRIGVYGEYALLLQEKIALNFGMREDYHSTYGYEWAPSISAGWWINPGFKLRGEVGRAFRVPSFTDLYYEDPYSKGNPNLKPEVSWGYELGTDFYPEENFSINVNGFLRDEVNLIDWVKGTGSDTRWLATNIGHLLVSGFELGLKVTFRVLKTSLNYSLINYQVQSGEVYIPKYASPQNQVSVGIEHPLCFDMSQSWGGIYKQRPGENGYFFLSTSLSRRFGNTEFYVKGTNLLNATYQDIKGVPSPGIWILGGTRWEM